MTQRQLQALWTLSARIGRVSRRPLTRLRARRAISAALTISRLRQGSSAPGSRTLESGVLQLHLRHGLPIHRAISRSRHRRAPPSPRRRRLERAGQRRSATHGWPSIIVRRTSVRVALHQRVEGARGERPDDGEVGGHARGEPARAPAAATRRGVGRHGPDERLGAQLSRGVRGPQLVEQIALAAQARVGAERQAVRIVERAARRRSGRRETRSTTDTRPSRRRR